MIALSVLDLTAYEVGNALLRGTSRVDARGVAMVLEALGQLRPRLSLTAGELAEAASLAERHRLTMYDAAYHRGGYESRGPTGPDWSRWAATCSEVGWASVRASSWRRSTRDAVQGVGEYSENGSTKTVAVAIGPEFGPFGPERPRR